MVAVTSANQGIVDQIARLDGARLRGYRDSLSFYQGQQWGAQTRRRERRLVFNYARTMIEKTASYLMTGLSFVVDEAGPSEVQRERARRAEQALREVYGASPSQGRRRPATYPTSTTFCRLVESKTPTEADPTQQWFCFQKNVRKDSGTLGFADVYYQNHFGW